MNQLPSFPADTLAFDSAAARLTVDLAAIVGNWRMLDSLSGKARASAVVKADGYGVGAEAVGRALVTAGCRDFFVATAAEGRRLRGLALDARIFVLNGVWPGAEQDVFTHNLVPVINSPEQLEYLLGLGGSHDYSLHVDTGMNRLGLTIADAQALSAMPGANPVLVMSHLACADDPGDPMNHRQCRDFRAVTALFPRSEASLSSSGGIFLGEDYHLDLTRPGIALYDGGTIEAAIATIKPVITAEARILQIRTVRAGETASYGATHRFERDGRIAVVGAGYADGWLRTMSGSGVTARDDGSAGAFGFLAGQKVPVVGRITMDLTTFDISAIPENRVRSGDYVELFGPNIGLGEAAKAAGTIGYELLTSLGARYARRHVHGVPA